MSKEIIWEERDLSVLRIKKNKTLCVFMSIIMDEIV